jgi:menaquinone-dependent protoporphyrinogen oxidase
MRILVAYASRLGSTREIAESIAGRLQLHGFEASALRAAAVGDVEAYDAVIVGSAVYAGNWMDEATQFIDGNRSALAARHIWLFSSGPVGHLPERVEPSAPGVVRRLMLAVGARGHRVFFGAFDRATIDGSDLGRAERFIAKRFVPTGDFRDWEAVAGWADDIAGELTHVSVSGPEASRIPAS